jgi:hypothetical protein
MFCFYVVSVVVRHADSAGYACLKNVKKYKKVLLDVN